MSSWYSTPIILQKQNRQLFSIFLLFHVFGINPKQNSCILKSVHCVIIDSFSLKWLTHLKVSVNNEVSEK